MEDKRTKGQRKGKGGAVIPSPHIDKQVPIVLKDGVERYLKFGMRAIDTLERCYPQGARPAVFDDKGNIIAPPQMSNPATPIREILTWARPGVGWPWGLLFNAMWAQLLHDWPSLTKEELENLIDPTRVGYYDDQVQEAMRIGLGIGLSEGADTTEEPIGAEEKNEPLTGES